jgi:hypothetical protein
MFEDYGYFTIRDVYPTVNVGVSTREKTKINSVDNDTPLETTETKAQAVKINDNINMVGVGKFFVGMILFAYLVNRFGK